MWSKGVIITTVLGVFLIIIGFVVMGLNMEPDMPEWEKTAVIVTTLFLLGLVAFITFTYPMKILMWEDSFIIKRLGGNKVIHHDDIKYIHRIRKKELNRRNKVFGSGGLFGYWGVFHTVEHGRFRIYSRNLRNMLFLEMRDGRKYVISYTPKSEQERDALGLLMER